MNAVNLYILCEGTKLDNWVDYQKVLTNSYEKKQLKKAEIDTLKRFVNELLNWGIAMEDLDGFFMDFLFHKYQKNLIC